MALQIALLLISHFVTAPSQAQAASQHPFRLRPPLCIYVATGKMTPYFTGLAHSPSDLSLPWTCARARRNYSPDGQTQTGAFHPAPPPLPSALCARTRPPPRRPAAFRPQRRGAALPDGRAAPISQGIDPPASSLCLVRFVAFAVSSSLLQVFCRYPIYVLYFAGRARLRAASSPGCALPAASQSGGGSGKSGVPHTPTKKVPPVTCCRKVCGSPLALGATVPSTVKTEKMQAGHGCDSIIQ